MDEPCWKCLLLEILEKNHRKDDIHLPFDNDGKCYHCSLPITDYNDLSVGFVDCADLSCTNTICKPCLNRYGQIQIMDGENPLYYCGKNHCFDDSFITN